MDRYCNFLKKITSVHDIFILLCTATIIASFTTAILSVPTQIAFYYDQARDGYQAYSIWHNHHLKILGPPTDVPGVFHGVLWYYFLAPGYWLANGNPVVVVYIFTLLMYLTVPFCGYIAYTMTKNKKVAFLSAALYACAPLFINYSHWLSNPVLTVLITPFLMYSLFKYIIKANAFFAAITGLLFGLIIQSDLAFLPLLVLIPVYIYVFRLKVKKSHISWFFAALLLALSTIIIAAIKFHSNELVLIFQSFFAATNIQSSLTSTIFSFIDTFVSILSITYICLPTLITGALILYFAYKLRKKYIRERSIDTIFLEIWTGSMLVLFLINQGNGSTIFFFAPVLFSMAILVAKIIYIAFPRKAVLVYVVLILFFLQILRNLIAVSSQTSYLVIQPGMIYSIETQVVDYTYREAHGQPFVISAITNPLYIATTWSYIFEFYGEPRYGYMPYWGGKSQVGQLNSFPENPKNIRLRFFIIDPTAIIPAIWVSKLTYEEDKLSDIQSEKQIGKFMVQTRLFHPNKPAPTIPEELIKDKDVLDF